MPVRPALALVLAAALLTGCGAGPEPADPTPTPSATSAPPTATSAPPTTASPTVETGLTLQQLGFDNGPANFSLPPDSVISTKVDQPNVVTVVLSSPGPETVEDYLRATLPDAGFRIDARSSAEGALTFKGEDWTGGFTGTGATSAIVLRPA